MLRCFFAIAFLLAAMPAFAWGPLGHRTIAALAQPELAPAARAEIERLLGPGHERSLVDVATWADDLRDEDPARFRETARDHFINFHGDCRYDARRDCRGGHCIVAALDRNLQILADRKRSRADRAGALRFVVHYVADIHQPLHAGYKNDKGGNTVQLRYGRENRNLHSVWDSLILNSAHRSWRIYADTLARAKPLRVPPGDNPSAWAEESCRVSRDEGVYPDGNRIDATWLDKQRPMAERRLRIAAKRLAKVLNRVVR